MSDLRNILKEEYKKKEEVAVTPQSLIEMIEQLYGGANAKGTTFRKRPPGAKMPEKAERFSYVYSHSESFTPEAWGDPNSHGSRQKY